MTVLAVPVSDRDRLLPGSERSGPLANRAVRSSGCRPDVPGGIRERDHLDRPPHGRCCSQAAVARRAPATVARRAAAARRRRALLSFLAVLVVVLLALPWGETGGRSGVAGTVTTRALSPHSVYVVQPGDTLWSIARRLDPSTDPRPIMAELAARNGGDVVAAGAALVLP